MKPNSKKQDNVEWPQNLNTYLGNKGYTLLKSELSIKHQLSLKESLMVFPNPAQDKVMIQFANKTAQIENIEIFDISGSLVKQFSKAEIDIDGSVDINNLQSGLYMIRVGTSDGKQFNNKLQKL